ncbi:MAG: 1,6-anhydro-N-acetylmuramyl-L-alanine amidase AmpD [Granulosicoccaceae bacterium]
MLSYDPCSGWLSSARRCPSPNCDQRSGARPVSLLVVHGISLPPGEFGGPYIDQLFCNQLQPREHDYFAEVAHLRVSAHALIRRNGELVQYVPLHQRAWHAGQSCFQGCEGCNDYSIGIELEGTDELPYDERQYQCLAEFSQLMMQYFPAIDRQRIAGHSDIAPGRKTDPGPSFDWLRFDRYLEQAAFERLC